MRLTAFFKLYKICIFLHRCNLKILAKNRFEKSAIFVKIQQKFCRCRKIFKFQKIQLDNLVDFGKCCKTRVWLQRSAPIQQKTNEILQKFCQKFATTLRVHRPETRRSRAGRGLRRRGDAVLRELPRPGLVPNRLDLVVAGVRVSKISKIGKILQIFGGLVLGCIKTKFCKKICV